MLKLPQKVKIRWHGNNKKWYIEKGYLFTKIREEFEVDVLDLMPKATQKIEVLCDFCGKSMQREYGKYTYRKENGKDCCNECISKRSIEVNVKYNFEYVQEEFEKRGFILLEDEYLNNYTNMKYICNNGHQNEITFKSVLKGYGCNECAVKIRANKIRRPIEKIKEIFKENGCLLLTQEYINNHQKLEYICECGNVDYKRLTHFLRGNRCEECTSRKRRESHRKYSLEDVKNIFKENNCILLEDHYINFDTKMRYICSCGRPSEITLGKFLAGCRCKRCAIEKTSGENHYNWNPYLTEEEREIGRYIEGYSKWRQQVYERDHYTCQCCGDSKGGNLNAHHLDGYEWCKEKRTDVNNGITLCQDCHIDFHRQYGYGDNTKEQFEEWIHSKQINLIERSSIMWHMNNLLQTQ